MEKSELKIIAELYMALEALTDKVDATSDCDHKRYFCEEIGCIGVEVKHAREVLLNVKPVLSKEGIRKIKPPKGGSGAQRPLKSK
jgi:hypothetical protein